MLPCILFAAILSLVPACAIAQADTSPAPDVAASHQLSSKRMADGKQWTTDNLNVKITDSYCYEDVEMNCRRYGRLYTLESARRGCQSLGGGWRLPTDDEWR
jgi:hypothetical protein